VKGGVFLEAEVGGFRTWKRGPDQQEMPIRTGPPEAGAGFAQMRSSYSWHSDDAQRRCPGEDAGSGGPADHARGAINGAG